MALLDHLFPGRGTKRPCLAIYLFPGRGTKWPCDDLMFPGSKNEMAPLANELHFLAGQHTTGLYIYHRGSTPRNFPVIQRRRSETKGHYWMKSLYTLHSKRHPRVETTTALQDPPNLRSALHTDPSHRRGPSRYADDHHGGLRRTWTPRVDAESIYSTLQAPPAC